MENFICEGCNSLKEWFSVSNSIKVGFIDFEWCESVRSMDRVPQSTCLTKYLFIFWKSSQFFKSVEDNQYKNSCSMVSVQGVHSTFTVMDTSLWDIDFSLICPETFVKHCYLTDLKLNSPTLCRYCDKNSKFKLE